MVIIVNIISISNKFTMVFLVYLNACVLSESIAYVVFRLHENYFQETLVHILSHKIISDVDMLHLPCCTMTFAHENCTHIVHSYHNWYLHWNIHCQKYLSNELNLFCSFAQCVPFCL